MSIVVMDVFIKEYVKELKLPAVGREYQALARQARQDGWSYEEYLRELLEAELCSRRDRTAKRRIHEARFPDVRPSTRSTGMRWRGCPVPPSPSWPAASSCRGPRT